MTVRDAARQLEISVSLAYKLVEEGRLKCVRLGQKGRRGTIRIRPADIEEFLRQCQAKSE